MSSKLLAELSKTVPRDLLTALEEMVDPRARRGKRHRLVTVLGIAVCAVLSGARASRTIAEWANDLTPTMRRRLGIAGRVPCEATIRRVLQRLDGEQFDLLICHSHTAIHSHWLARRAGPCAALLVIAIDGKTARGARAGDARAAHMVVRRHPGTLENRKPAALGR